MMLLLSGYPPLMVRFARFIRKLFVLEFLCIMQLWGRLFFNYRNPGNNPCFVARLSEINPYYITWYFVINPYYITSIFKNKPDFIT